VAADNAGNLYVADSANNTIRKVVIATGAVTTLAGTAGVTGGADGTDAAAQFNGPSGICADNAGNLYVADTYNDTIRKIVVATGVVSTIAGTAGSGGSANGGGPAAQFLYPQGIATDNAGNLYVADTYNDVIRRIVIAGAAVSTVAGGFNRPVGLVVDSAGNVDVASYGSQTISQVVAATGMVTTLAGTAGVSGSKDGTGTAAQFNFSYQTGLAADSAGNLYVGDTSNDTVRKIVIATGAVTTLAGKVRSGGSADGTGTAALFNQPGGVAVDGAGNLYLADSGNSTIREMIIATSAVTTLAGSAVVAGSADGSGAAALFNSPFGVAADNAGNLYVADAGNDIIRQIVIATGAVTTLAGKAGTGGSADGSGPSALFESPYGVAADNAGNLYVADSGNDTIRQIVIATGAVTTLAGSTGTSGSADGSGPSALFYSPYAVAADNAGNLYVADSGNNTIRQIVIATGAVTTLAGTAGIAGSADGTGAAAQFFFPVGISADNAGNLYVADSGNNTIRQIVIASGVVTTLAGSATDAGEGSADGTGPGAQFDYPLGVAADNAGHLYVADNYNNTIRQIVISSAVVSTVVGVAGQEGFIPGVLPGVIAEPQGVAVAGGDLYFTTYNAAAQVGPGPVSSANGPILPAR
jgi:hypothetical protein